MSGGTKAHFLGGGRETCVKAIPPKVVHEKTNKTMEL